MAPFRFINPFLRLINVGWGGGYILRLTSNALRDADNPSIPVGDASVAAVDVPGATFAAGHGEGTAYPSVPSGAPPAIFNSILVSGQDVFIPPAAADYRAIARTQHVVNIGGGGDGNDDEGTYSTRDVVVWFFVPQYLASLGDGPRPTQLDFEMRVPPMEKFPADITEPDRPRGFTQGQHTVTVYRNAEETFWQLFSKSEREDDFTAFITKVRLNLLTGDITIL